MPRGRCCRWRGTCSCRSHRGTSRRGLEVAKKLIGHGYTLLATPGTCDFLNEAGVSATRVNKLQQGRPNLLDYLAEENVALVMNTPIGKGARTDEGKIRAAATAAGVPCLTTIEACEAAATAMVALATEEMEVESLQERFDIAEATPV